MEAQGTVGRLGREEALRAYAAMMNTLDASRFMSLLDEDFHYASQWVFNEIESKQEYLEYITGKLKAFGASGLKVWAENGRTRGILCRPVSRLRGSLCFCGSRGAGRSCFDCFR